MDLNEYQREARKTAVYPPLMGLIYSVLGLSGEAGELANKLKKTIRDGSEGRPTQSDIAAELGDVLWYVSAVADNLGFSLEEIATSNLTKLRLREENGTLKGSGDER